MRRILQVIAFFLLSLSAFCQEQRMSNTTLHNYEGKLSDAGGSSGNYYNGENVKQVIHSDNGKRPLLNFTYFNIENGFDFLYIYDGADERSKLIGAYSGGDAPGYVQATGNDLTLVFTSDASGTAGGWIAEVNKEQVAERGIAPVATGTDCSTSDPFCTGTTYSFPASTNNTAPSGPSYGCLLSQPNPAFYYMQIGNSGNLSISIGSGSDVDFVCWGPFASQAAACASTLPGSCSGDHNCSGGIADCSYSISATETCTINNAVAGEIYVLCITNYANVPQNITFSQTGGTGSTNCSIVCSLTATNTGPYCVGSTISLTSSTVAGATYAWNGPGGFTSALQNPTIPNATVGNSGTYTVSATDGNGTCTYTTAVTVSAGPVVSATSATVCAGSPATLTASGTASYTWNPGGVTTSTLSVSPATTTVYTVSGTTGTCPVTTATGTVTVVPAITVSSTTICAGASATLTATGATSYTWMPGGSTGASITVSPASTTVYTVDSGGGGTCSVAQSTVTVIPALTVTVNTPPSMCSGSSATLTANGATSYTWTPATGLSSTNTASVAASPAATTVYTVSGSSGSCPSASASTTVTILPSISVNSATICAGASATLTATGAANYTWTPGGSTGTSITVSPATTTVYTVNSGGGGTCSVTQSTVTVVPTLSVSASTSTVICAGTAVTLTATGAATYSWSPGTGLSTTSGSTTIASPNATTTYTVTGSSGSCPSATAVTTVSVTPSYTLTVGSATICPTTSTTLTASGAGPIISWSPATGLSSTTAPVVTASPASTTAYTVSGGSCDVPGTCTVTVLPSCSITVNSATLCPNQSVTLTANGGGPYTWSPATGLSSTSGTTVVAAPASTTIYTVTSISGIFTITATSTVVILASPTITVNNATICEGKTINLTANGASTYTWVPASGLSSAATASMVVANPSVTTTYTITGMATNGCTNTAISTVGVNPMPTVTVTPSSARGCAPVCLTYTSLSSSASLNYNWDFGDGASSVAPNPEHCYQSAGAYTATVSVIDANGCKSSSVSTATVYPNPVAGFYATPQPASILEPTIQFIDQTTSGPVTHWTWDFGTISGGDTSHLKNPTYTYTDTGTYVINLWVTSFYGCNDSTTRIIHIDDDYELFVPTAFSPNGDGLNEIFMPVTRGVLQGNYHFYVYDRWGNLIFQTSELNKGWDGTLHGVVVLQDVFVWKINLVTTAGIKKQVHGQVSVVK